MYKNAYIFLSPHSLSKTRSVKLNCTTLLVKNYHESENG